MSTTDLGEFVRRRREELRMSQDELAATVGVVPQQISNIELGKTGQPRNETLTRLARALQVSPQVIGALIGMYQETVDKVGTAALPDELTPVELWNELVRRFNGDERAARQALLETLQWSFPR